MDEIARRRRANLERDGTGGADGPLETVCHTVQMAEADREFRGCVDDGYFGLFQVLFGEAERLPLCTAHGPNGAAKLEIATKPLLAINHRSACLPLGGGYRVEVSARSR